MKALRTQYPVSMSLFCLSHNFVYLLYFCLNWDRSKINKQGCGLTGKGHGNGVKVIFQILQALHLCNYQVYGHHWQHCHKPKPDSLCLVQIRVGSITDFLFNYNYNYTLNFSITITIIITFA